MIYRRKERWGHIGYDTARHDFYLNVSGNSGSRPYVKAPVVLNVDLTFRCNMNCCYCVAKDTSKILGKPNSLDLKVSREVLKAINTSGFLLVVITGGEPFLPEVESSLTALVSGIQKKGIVVDTNGTIKPSVKTLQILVRKHAMVRVSWDSPTPSRETYFRKYGSLFKSDRDYMKRKEQVIRLLSRQGLTVAVQSVVSGVNYADSNFHKLPYRLKELGINKLYLQRIIPSHKVLYDTQRKKHLVTYPEYSECVANIEKHAQLCDVKCISKMDRRHNSVFLLVHNGDIYTQSDEEPGKKVWLGPMARIEDYFEYVSSADHASRYYAQKC